MTRFELFFLKCFVEVIDKKIGIRRYDAIHMLIYVLFRTDYRILLIIGCFKYDDTLISFIEF